MYCEDGTKDRVEAALAQEGLQRMDFHFESDGARVLSNAGVRLSETASELQPYERGSFRSKS